MILSPSHDTSSSTSNSGDAHIQVDETKEEEEELVVGGKQAIVDAIRSKLDRKLKV